jgi:cardiolipin synthase
MGLALASALFHGCTVIERAVPQQQRNTYTFEPSFGVGTAEFRRSLDNVASPMIGGNDAEILENGDAVFGAMLRDIRQAKLSVNVEMYIYTADDAGTQFSDALIDAARRGVAVRLLTDAVGEHLGSLRQDLEAAGVVCKTFRPFRLHSLLKLERRTHRKLVIVDGKVGFTGGLCIDKRWLGNARDKTEWRDTMVRVTGPITAEMQAIFSEDWTYTTGEILAGAASYPRLEPTGSLQLQAVKTSRGDASSLPKMLYFMAIKAARKSIYIENSYFLPDKQMREALVAAVHRGVEVKVMVPGNRNDVPLVRMASRFHYGPLLKEGVRIYEYETSMLHNKTMVVDGVFSTIGSINFDARSMSYNAEDSLAFYDRSFADKMEAMFQRDLKRCNEVTYESWSHRGALARMSETVTWIWEPYY